LIGASPTTSVDQRPKVNREIAAAKAMVIPRGVEFVRITGETKIEEIESNGDGQVVMLKFASTAIVKNGNNLILAGDFEGSANRILALITDGSNWYELFRTRQNAIAPTALTEKAEKTETEPSATRTTIVTGRVETASATRTVIKILVGATVVAELEASVTVTGKSFLPFCFAVPAGSKWKWEKVEGTVEANGFKFSSTVL
jgi:hypothetical protein